MAESVGSVALDIVVGKDEVTGKLNNFGKVAGGVAKTLGAGLAVASGAVLALGKQAVASYGEYEQLVGGVQTLYGNAGKSMEEWVNEQAKALGERGIQADIKGLEDRWKAYAEVEQTVLKNAGNAYRTAGLSANEYMSTITGFTAALKQCIDDTSVVAEYADMAVTDMADNANKMGTSMESIQNAYQGFAKQNYTMLDNLKLGYGGTKGEMERLLEDASAIAGIEFDISSYADVVEAIHIIQQNMGITGTTALEASQTIQGSISAMGASWQNLLTGLTDPTQNFDELINNFVESVGTVAENLVPRLSNVLNGIVNLVTQLSPVIVAEVPNMVKTILPSLLEGAISIVSAVIEALPSLLGMIVEMLPTLIPLLINGLVNMIVMLCTNFATIIQPLIDNLPIIITSIVDGLLNNLPQLIQGLIMLTIGIVQAIPQITAGLIECIPQIIVSVVGALTGSAPILLDGVTQLVGTVYDILMPIINWIDTNVIQPIKAIIEPIVAWFDTNIIQPVVSFFKSMWAEISEMASLAWEAIKAIWDAVAPYFEGTWEWIKSIFSVAWEAIKGYFTVAWEWIKGIWDGVTIYFTLIWENIKAVFSVVGDVLSNYFKMAWENIKVVWDLVVGYFSMVWENIKLIFSVVKDVFTGNFQGAWDGIKAIFDNVGGYFSQVWNGIEQIFANVGSFFTDSFNSAWNGVQKVFSNFTTFFSNIWESIKKTFSNVGTAIGNAITNTVKTAINGVLSTAVNIINGFISAINVAIGIINAIPGVNIGKLSKLNVPQLEQGGVLKKGQVGLLEGKGAEAVIPLERNTGWLNRIADILNQKIGLGSFATAIERAVSAPALHNVKAGTSFGEQDNSKLNRLIELFERFIAEDNGDMTVPIYIGNELIDEYIVNKNSRQKLRSGGHA